MPLRFTRRLFMVARLWLNLSKSGAFPFERPAMARERGTTSGLNSEAPPQRACMAATHVAIWSWSATPVRHSVRPASCPLDTTRT